jgi:ribosomal protein L37E
MLTAIVLDLIKERAVMPQESPYEEQWERFRRINRLAFWVLCTYLPGSAIIGVPLSRLADSDWPLALVGATWLIAVLVTDRAAIRLKCPRCGKPFFHTWWFHNGFAKKCVHCGLPKRAKHDRSKLD